MRRQWLPRTFRRLIHRRSRRGSESRSHLLCSDRFQFVQPRLKPVAHREQAPEAIRILPAPDAGAATVAARAPARVAVRFHRQVNESVFRNREIHS